MKHLLNLFIRWIYLKKWKAKSWDVLKPEVYELFKQKGEGLYYSVFQSAASDWTSKQIGKFCKGLSHTFAMLYSENLREWFSDEQWQKIEKRFKFYYGPSANINDMKVLVLGSADPTGMNYFDFSEYQRRHQCMRKVPNSIYSKETQMKVAQWFVEIPFNMPYDFVGLLGYMVSKKIYDKYAFYCSNQVFEAFKSQNIFVADQWNPKPSHIQEYNKQWKIYNTLEVCK